MLVTVVLYLVLTHHHCLYAMLLAQAMSHRPQRDRQRSSRLDGFAIGDSDSGGSVNAAAAAGIRHRGRGRAQRERERRRNGGDDARRRSAAAHRARRAQRERDRQRNERADARRRSADQQRARRAAHRAAAGSSVNAQGEELSLGMEGEPTPAQVAQFDTAPDILQALQLFAETCGLAANPEAHWLPAAPPDAAIGLPFPLPAGGGASGWAETGCALVNGLNGRLDGFVVTAGDKQRCLADAARILDPQLRLLACAACGVRDYTCDPDVDFPLCSPTEFPELRLGAAALAKHDALGAYRAIADVWTAPSGDRYYLHPELVSVTAAGDATMRLCAHCCQHLRARRVPPLSIASTVSFGCPGRLHGLPPLTRVEQLLISAVRIYALVVKLTPGAGGQSALKGHVIAFPHQGPAVAGAVFRGRLPRVDDVTDAITVVYVGSDGNRERALTAALACPHLRARADVVFAWLHMLAALQPDARAWALEDTPAVREAIDGLQRRLAEAAIVANDRQTQLLECIATADVAEVRRRNDADGMSAGASSASRGSPGTDQVGHSGGGDAVNDMGGTGGGDGAGWNDSDQPLSSVLLNPAAPMGDVRGTLLRSIRAAAVGDTDGDGTAIGAAQPQHQQRPPIAVRRDADPMNEFVANRDLLYGAFPHLFPLRTGLGNRGGSVSCKLVRHMLLQFHGQFARDHLFIFTMFNQRQRHAAARAVAARVHNKPSSFAAFAAVVSAPSFLEQLDRATAEPDGEDAKTVLRLLGPHIRAAGGAVPYGPVMRANALSQLYAMVHRFGVPSFFVTISPDDVHHVLAVRVSIPSRDNFSFPAAAGGLLDALRGGEASFEGVPIREIDLQRLAAGSPVAAAALSKRVMEAVVSALLGLAWDVATRVTSPVGARLRGVLGRAVAAFFVKETQGRGALHDHGLVWVAELTPLLLQAAAGIPGLVQKLATAINSVLQADLPPTTHVRHLLGQLEGQPTPRCCWIPTPLPLEAADAYRAKVDTCMNVLQKHTHSATCRKGTAGEFKCRLAKPSGTVDATCVVQLLQDEDDDDGEDVEGVVADAARSAEPQVADMVEPDAYGRTLGRNYLTHPLPDDDPRVVAWELRRPRFPPLPDMMTRGAANRVLARLSDSDRSLLAALSEGVVRGDLAQYALPEDLCERLAALPHADWMRIARALPRRNGSLTEVSDAMTALLACNTAVYLLGSTEQAKAALFYLVKYITKDSTPLATSLSVVHAAMKDIEAYPSVADDSGQPQRTGQHLLQRILNKLSGASEVSAEQAAAELIGCPAHQSTHSFEYLFVRAAVAYYKQLHLTATGGDAERPWQGGGDDTDGSSDSSSRDGDVGGEDLGAAGRRGGSRRIAYSRLDGGDDREADLGDFGGAPVYLVNGVPTPVPQHTNYALRGPALAVLTLYEYVGIISIVPKRVCSGDDQLDDDGTDSDAGGHSGDEDGPRRHGRHFSTTFEFDSRHPLRETHVQRIRSKQVVPLITGRPPRYPGPRCARAGASWQRSAARWACFIQCLFRPWDADSFQRGGDLEGVAPHDFAAVGIYIAELEGAPPVESGTPQPPSHLGRYRAATITNVSRNLSINNDNKKLLTRYRMRAAAVWGGATDFAGTFEAGLAARRRLGATGDDVNDDSDLDTGDGGDAEAEAYVAAAAAVEQLRAAARADAQHDAHDGIAESRYIGAVRAALDQCFGEPGHQPALAREPAAVGAHGSQHGGPIDGILRLRGGVVATERVRDALRADPDPERLAHEHRMEREALRRGAELRSQRGGGSEAEADDLNAEQARALAVTVAYVEALAAWRRDPSHYPHPQPLRLLVHGGPGVGKTHWIRRTQQELAVRDMSMAATAFTGVAASLIPYARTIHGLLGLPIEAAAAYTWSSTRQPSRALQAALRERLKDVTVLLIDEVSMVGPVMLAHIDRRLQHIRGISEPFGGLAVILTGDFFQLPPVCPSESLYQAVLRYYGVVAQPRGRDGDLAYGPGSPWATGAALFATFLLREFVQQMRARTDPGHTNMLDVLRSWVERYPITDATLSTLMQHMLTAEDGTQARWRAAPIVVTGNAERLAIDMDQARRLAIDLRRPVLTWRHHVQLPPEDERAMGNHGVDEMYRREASMMGVFVQGTKAYLTENINPSKGLANGTPVILHSLTFGDDIGEERLMLIEAAIRQAAPGETVVLDVAPRSINVAVPPDVVNPALWPANETLVPGEVVVPVFMMRAHSTGKHGIRVPPYGGLRRSTRAHIKPHAVEPAYAKTYYKIQGDTVPAIILDLNRRPTKPTLTFRDLLIGLSRSRTGNDYRILPPVAAGSLDHLRSLGPDPHLRVWRAAYDSEGRFDVNRARQAAEQERQLAAAGRVSGRRRPREDDDVGGSEEGADGAPAARGARGARNVRGRARTLCGGRGTAGGTGDGVHGCGTGPATGTDDVRVRGRGGGIGRGRGGGGAGRGGQLRMDPAGFRVNVDDWMHAPTFSWLLVPLAHAVLGLNLPHVTQLRQYMGNDNAFTAVVQAYRADWQQRGIVTPADAGCGPDGYIQPDRQLQLLDPEAPGVDKPAPGLWPIYQSLAAWATSFRTAKLDLNGQAGQAWPRFELVQGEQQEQAGMGIE
jgi:hypothetical protein